MSCPIKEDSNKIELTVHTSCYCVSNLLCVTISKTNQKFVPCHLVMSLKFSQATKSWIYIIFFTFDNNNKKLAFFNIFNLPDLFCFKCNLPTKICGFSKSKTVFIYLLHQTGQKFKIAKI